MTSDALRRGVVETPGSPAPVDHGPRGQGTDETRLVAVAAALAACLEQYVDQDDGSELGLISVGALMFYSKTVKEVTL